MSNAPTLWQYRIPSENGEGWAIAVLGSDGFFGVVSDYGNYAYLWSSTGMRDFRDFFCGIDGDYVRGKLDPSTHFDSEKTQANVRKHLEERKGQCDAPETMDIDSARSITCRASTANSAGRCSSTTTLTSSASTGISTNTARTHRLWDSSRERCRAFRLRCARSSTPSAPPLAEGKSNGLG